MRYDYTKEYMQHVEIRGFLCEFNDLRLDRNTIPKGRYLYEVADDDSDGEPVRIRPSILVNFFGSIICDKKLVPDEGDTIWLQEGDWKWRDDVSDTRYIFTLHETVQSNIRKKLLEVGLSIPDIERGMNGRVCDLEDTINVWEIW